MRKIRIKNAALTLLALWAIAAVAACQSAPPRPVVESEPEKQTYQNGSLWPGAGKKNMFFSDNKASRVGDIVTVQVLESTTAINKAETNDEHSVNNTLTIDTGGTSATKMEVGGGVKTRGKGQTGRSDRFSATVSCLVTEVLANGNMRIEGQRRMQINKEEQYIVVRGLIRPDDVNYDNTILSTQIAQADILYTGKGGIDSGRQPNWLGRVLQVIWPF